MSEGKKVALVTCYFQPNYGSMLQALATQEALNLMHIPNETIRIDGLQSEIRSAKIRYFCSRLLSVDVIRDKIGYVRLAIKKKMNRNIEHNLSVRRQCFSNYAKRRFTVSRLYHSKKELEANAGTYSAFLVGSDQLWLPSNIAADYYTLNFVPDSVRKIAYATSFGISSLPPKQADIAKQFIPRFEYLSVREKSGQDLVKDLTGLDAKLVCDPTLLLTQAEWTKLIPEKRIIKEKYIFCYFLGNNPLSRQCARYLKKRTGYKIVALQHLDEYFKEDESFADKAPYRIDPDDFVNLIRYAEFVCTDSFHGTVFSIINQKSFFSFRRFVQKTTMSTNSRLDSLLNVLDIEKRLIQSPSEFKTAVSADIDYAEVNHRLDDFRKGSKAFLEESLEGLHDI